MTLQLPLPLDVAFVPRSRISLASCINQLRGHTDLPAPRKRDLVSALLRLSAILDRAPEALPADPVWLQPRLSKIQPAAIGLKQKSWTNILSNAKAAFKVLGIVPRSHRLADLSPLWAPLWQRVLQSGNIRVSRSLGRFVRCMDNLAISPDRVDLEAALLYKRALEEAELHDTPVESMYQAIRGWNRAVRDLPWWPGKVIEPPTRRKTYVIDPASFPEAFRQDVARFRKRMEAPDLLDPDAPAAPLRPATVKHRVSQTWRLASAIVHGGTSIETITSFSALLVPSRVRQGLEWLLARQNGRSSPGLSDIGTLIRILVTHVGELDQRDREATLTLSRRVTVPAKVGMTERNRARLRPFENSDLLGRLFALSVAFPLSDETVWPHKTAKRHEVLLAIRLLLFCPIRLKNLAAIHLERNLVRFGDGRVFLRFTPDEVKNRRFLEFQLDSDIVRMIDLHIRMRSRLLPAVQCEWLFADGKGAGPRSQSCLASQIKKLLLRELGTPFNPHLFRHLAAMLWLKQEPGNYEVVRLFLGHSTVSSTISAYADFDQSGAVALLGKAVRQSAGSN
jgi:integrase